MAYVIDDSCINCEACVEECPVEAISAGDDMHVIDADACTWAITTLSPPEHGQLMKTSASSVSARNGNDKEICLI